MGVFNIENPDMSPMFFGFYMGFAAGAVFSVVIMAVLRLI
jgi:hypothetical protein